MELGAGRTNRRRKRRRSPTSFAAKPGTSACNNLAARCGPLRRSGLRSTAAIRGCASNAARVSRTHGSISGKSAGHPRRGSGSLKVRSPAQSAASASGSRRARRSNVCVSTTSSSAPVVTRSEIELRSPAVALSELLPNWPKRKHAHGRLTGGDHSSTIGSAWAKQERAPRSQSRSLPAPPNPQGCYTDRVSIGSRRLEPQYRWYRGPVAQQGLNGQRRCGREIRSTLFVERKLTANSEAGNLRAAPDRLSRTRSTPRSSRPRARRSMSG